MKRSVVQHSLVSRILVFGCVGNMLMVWAVTTAAAKDYDGPVTVDKGETFVLNDGERVVGDLLVMGGDATVNGSVEGDLIATDGKLMIGKTAYIGGKTLVLRSAPGVSTDPGKKPDITFVSPAELMERLGPQWKPGSKGVQVRERAPEGRLVSGDLLRFAEAVTVPRGERRDGDVVVFGGDIRAEGDVDGDLASFGGKITVGGEVTGDIACYGGGVTLKDGAHVKGDIASFGGKVTRAPGAQIDGTINDVSNPAFPGLPMGKGHSASVDIHGWPAMGLLSWLWGLIASVVTVVLVVLIAPNATRTIAGRTYQNPGRAVAHGALAAVLLVPVCVLLSITCVGILLIPVLVVAMALAIVMGTVAVSSIMGRRLSDTFRWRVRSLMGTAMIGMLALQAIDLLGLIPAVGVLAAIVGLIVVLFGLGGALMTGFGSDRECRWVTRRFSRRVAAQNGAYAPGPGDNDLGSSDW